MPRPIEENSSVGLQLLGAMAALWFWRRLPLVREALRPIYRDLGIIREKS